MIEDYQDEYYQPERRRKHKIMVTGKPVVYILAAWVVFSTLTVIVSLPKIKTTLQETDAFNIISNTAKIRGDAQSCDVTVYFAQSNRTGNVSFVPYKVHIQKTGATEFHDAIEGLFAGPTDQALGDGAISFISGATKLRGISVSGSTVFVDVTPYFAVAAEGLGTNVKDIARLQILKTVQLLDNSIRNIVILENGNPIS
ncbi:MAG: GerMN domain-containing protein [Sphaerochaetaceae bacterium]|nr:GerMN domain-containing protein [Sphaerochaetaceae bacterium]